MEYGFWSLLAARGLGGDPRLACRVPNVLTGTFNSRALNNPSGSDQLHQPMELTTDSKKYHDIRSETSTPFVGTAKESADYQSTNEKDENDEDIDNQGTTSAAGTNENADEEVENDTESSNSSYPLRNNNLSPKPLDSLAYFGLDKDENRSPLLNGWVLGAYTAMLERLSAATAVLKATEVPGIPSDSDSETDYSSYTEGSSGSSPAAGSCRGYPCDSCNIVAASRPALKKHIFECHPLSSDSEPGIQCKRRCPSNSSDSTSRGVCELDSHTPNHVDQGLSRTGTKRSLALQRVRYRYEREEYKCTLCSYACTIEKAFQRHLRAHAKGAAPETRVSCAVCGADRSSEVDLSRHMRRHRDDRFFCCDICVFRTVQLKKLIQHRRMHTGEKPHLCPHCAYRSARRDNLRSHVRRVHKKENLYCDTFNPRGMFITPSISTSSIVGESVTTIIPDSSSPPSSCE